MKRLFIIIGLLLLLPFAVDAKSQASITCTKSTVIIGQTFSCDVTVNPSEPITSLKANLDWPSDVTLKKIEPTTGWTSNSNSLIDLVNPNYEDGQGLTNSLNIVTLSFEVNKNNVNYGPKQIKIHGFDLENESIASFSIQSSNSYVKSINISGIDFAFNYNNYSYDLKTTKESISINAILQDTNAKFKEGYGSRTVNLNYGKNTVQVIAIAQNGASTTYTLNIERLDQRSNNNNLASLTVSEGKMSPAFNKNVLTYNVEVPDGTKQVSIEAKKESESSSYNLNFGPRTVNLVDGLTTAIIEVISETGISKTYTLNITPKNKSVNNYLKAVKISGANINFDKNVFEYKVNVLYPTTEMDIIAVPEDMKAKVEVIGNKTLAIGENVFTVNVIAENGAVLSYKFIVNRLEEGRVLSNNNYLSELLINNYQIDFNKDVLEYNVKIKNEKQLIISYSSEDETAIVNVTGNNNLKNGSRINIIVTSEDKTTRTYTINVAKDEKSHILYYVILGVLLVVAIIVLIVSKAKDNKPKKKEDNLNLKLSDKNKTSNYDLSQGKLILGSKKDSSTLTGKPEKVNIPKEK